MHIKDKIIIATIKSWNINNAKLLIDKISDKYDVLLIDNKKDFNYDFISKFNPEYIFFPHWSWIIPKNIYENFECIVFHMTDLPYGRGGSPLQNLIINKQYQTKISAIKVAESIDAGDVYFKEDFNIEHGNANEILCRASLIIFTKMIPKILESKPKPVKQGGEVVNFTRRTPEESNISTIDKPTINDLYDFIRMLDGEGYPKAFLSIGSKVVEFSGVKKKDGILKGNFEVRDEK